MDSVACNVVYVDRGVKEDCVVDGSHFRDDGSAIPPWLSDPLRGTLSLLTGAFGEVHACATGAGCMSKLFDHDTSLIDLKPTLVLIDVPHDEPLPEGSSWSRSTSPHSRGPSESEADLADSETYGLRLLEKLVTEAHLRNLSKLVVPITIVNSPPSSASAATGSVGGNGVAQPGSSLDGATASRRLLRRCLDLGATDVLTGPLHPSQLNGLEVHAYRAQKEAARDQQTLLEIRRGRQRSWVGVSEEKPYAYLRESMVSGLMGNICKVSDERDDRISSVRISVSTERKAQIADAIGKWYFCAHDFSDDELVVASSIMFKHALSMPELEKWRIPTDQLRGFLVAVRAAYNSFVPYHNFRHVVDVLQATFNFLVNIGSVSPYPPNQVTRPATEKSPIAMLLTPFEALTLLVTAIGHDVGHPGVNNGFLVVINAPLAQLYNDRSVLESFHCAAYSQILRRYWPSVFSDIEMRSLMISSILATDMGLHFEYMAKLGALQGMLQRNNSTDGWTRRMLDEQKVLACSLLIKCADISNVARRHDAALKWMHILADEFSRQAAMESELNIKTSLMGRPSKEQHALFQSQLNFMNLFAIPLFKRVADILPAMKYCVDELEVNKKLFEDGIAESQSPSETRQPADEGGISPKSSRPDRVALNRERQDAEHGESGMQEDLDIEPGKVLAPAAVIVENRGDRDEQPFTPAISPLSSPAATKTAHNRTAALSHQPNVEYRREVNGIVTSFDAVADFAASDPFHVNDTGSSRHHHHHHHGSSSKQRCSETTEGTGSSLPYTASGDWQSQATSATTGRMPLSPSTQATSNVSRDSIDRPRRPSSVPAPANRAKAIGLGVDRGSMIKLHAETRIESHPGGDSDGSLAVPGHEGRLVKKKSASRFLIPHFSFFKRHKGNPPPVPAADMAG